MPKPLYICFLLLYICVFHISADDTLNVVIQTAPLNPLTGRNFTVTVFVDHPVTHEVSVVPPDFPPNLALERVRTESRAYRLPGQTAVLGEGDEQATRWTVVEFLFVPQAAGRITFEPFIITAGERHNETTPVTILIQNPAPPPAAVQTRVNPTFRWDGPPASASERSAVQLNLILVNWDPALPVPRNLFAGNVPQGIILEEVSSSVIGDNLFHYSIRLIPLQTGNIVLGPFTVQHEGLRLEIPRISIAVTAAGTTSVSAAGAAQAIMLSDDLTAMPDTEESSNISKAIFPEHAERVFPLFQREYNKIVDKTRALWDEGQYAFALATIRRYERDKLFSYALVPLRKSMEDNLGLLVSADESPRYVLPAIAVIFVFFLIFVLIRVTSSSLKGYKHIIVIIFGGGILLLLIQLDGSLRHLAEPSAIAVVRPAAQTDSEAPDGVYPADAAADIIMPDSGIEPRPGRFAVLKGTPVYRIPYSGSAVIIRFNEGQPVRIRSSAGAWIYIESPDSRSGWVPADVVILY